jgi:hypothetical protein
MSATATLGWTLTNWGPVFTTYIPPSSCTTTTAVLAQTQYPDLGSWGTQCYNNDCWPYPGTDEQKSAILKNRLLEPYFSPGVACPTGWKSIGALARASDGPIASRGVFTVMVGDSDDYNDEVPYSPSLYDALGAILDEGETMIACCPRYGLLICRFPYIPLTMFCRESLTINPARRPWAQMAAATPHYHPKPSARAARPNFQVMTSRALQQHS